MSSPCRTGPVQVLASLVFCWNLFEEISCSQSMIGPTLFRLLLINHIFVLRWMCAILCIDSFTMCYKSTCDLFTQCKCKCLVVATVHVGDCKAFDDEIDWPMLSYCCGNLAASLVLAAPLACLKMQLKSRYQQRS